MRGTPAILRLSLVLREGTLLLQQSNNFCTQRTLRMWSYVRRLKLLRVAGTRTILSVENLGPLFNFQLGVKTERKLLEPHGKHWTCRGPRGLAMGATLLRDSEVIAFPIDSSYVFVSSCQNNYALSKLQCLNRHCGETQMKIVLGNVKYISEYAHTCDLTELLLRNSLPGYITYILRRKNNLNPRVNPGECTIPLRIPHSPFLRSLATLIGPLATIEAKTSDGQIATDPKEFNVIWGALGGIFYEQVKKKTVVSPIIDLSQEGKFKIVGGNSRTYRMMNYMRMLGLSELD